MEQMELRVLSSSLTSDDSNLIVEGLVNETESWSHVLGNRKKFRERIAKGVFNDALREAKRIDFLGEHKQDLLLATTENGSLELWEDGQGLKMKAKIAPTSYGKDFYTLMAEKLISHMSFGFKVIKDVWQRGVDGIYERTITKIELKEVSVVRNPAYPASAIAARGIELVNDVVPEDVEETQNKEQQQTTDIGEVLNKLIEKIDTVINQKEQSIVKEDKVEDIQTDQEEVNNESNNEDEQIVKEETEVINNETQSNETEKTVVVEEKKIEEVTVVEEQVIENKENEKEKIIDLFQKYKEIQRLK